MLYIKAKMINYPQRLLFPGNSSYYYPLVFTLLILIDLFKTTYQVKK